MAIILGEGFTIVIGITMGCIYSIEGYRTNVMIENATTTGGRGSDNS